MKKNNKSEAAARLREKAEDLLKKKKSKTASQISETEINKRLKTASRLSETDIKKPLKAGTQPSEADTQRLIHELEVHQIELELLNQELLEAKEQAETNAEKYTELYDFAPAGYFTLSKEGDIIKLNLSGAKMLGQERSHLINKKFRFFVSEDTRQFFNDFLRKVFESKTKESGEAALSTDGNLPMHIYITGIIAENGERCFMTVVDITERKKAEEVLRESDTQFRNLLEDILSVSVQGYAPDGTTQYWNQASERLYGYTAQEAIGNNLLDLIIPPDMRGNVEHAIRQMAETGQPIPPAELSLMRKDGSRISVFSSHAIVHVPGMPPELFCIDIDMTDITERKKAEAVIKLKNEELQRTNAEKDKFFSIIAHDLRSPFNGFLGLTEIMAEGLHCMTLEEIQKIAVTMKKSANNLYSLLGNLLEWSRMQRGLIPFEPKLFLLMPEITESMALVTEAADKKEIAISYDIPEDLTVFADGNMVEGIIRNLSSNAVKFTRKGGVVNVSAKTMPDNSVEISIKDTGIGMDKEMINNLFRIDIDTSRKGTEDESSTGLGLIICKDFIEKHGGKLRVESEEGKGSTFYFTIPKHKG
jgi:PAS domain S-box-containing protein